MKAHAQELIAAAAHALAGSAHTVEELHVALFQLTRNIATYARLTVPASMRRRPLANEVLPRHQRAAWARELTAYDVGVGEDEIIVEFLHRRNRRLSES